MTDLDVYPADVRGPHTTTGQAVVTFARIFTHAGRLFIAESRNRGNTVLKVTEYAAPDAPMERDPRRSKAGSWGPWSWSSCGCNSGWRRHKIADLVALAPPLGQSTELDPGIMVPAGDLPSRVAWVSETDDVAERKARAEAIYRHQQDAEPGSDLVGLDEVLTKAVQSPPRTDHPEGTFTEPDPALVSAEG